MRCPGTHWIVTSQLVNSKLAMLHLLSTLPLFTFSPKPAINEDKDMILSALVPLFLIRFRNMVQLTFCPKYAKGSPNKKKSKI